MGGSVLSDELKRFFGMSLNVLPTTSAFVQQRKKLKDELFPHLFYQFNHALAIPKTKDGMYWLAADGTDVNLPTNRKDTENYVEYAKKTGGYYQMHVNALCSMFGSSFQDIVIQPRPEFNEIAALCTMVDRCPFGNNTVFVCDRGYPSWNLMAHIIEKGKYLLIRTKSPNSSGSLLSSLKIPLAEEFDKEITLKFTRSHKAQYKKHPDQYRVVRKSRPFDFIPVGDRETIYTMNFRVVCIQLSDKHYEYIITNLPADKFDLKKIKYYYNRRWNIETAFRHLKYRGGLVNFHSANRAYIKQEIYARLILFNYTSILAEWANENKKPKPDQTLKYKVAFSEAYSVVRESLKAIMTDEEILNHLCRYQVPIRSGRKATRKVQSQSARPLSYRN